MSLKRDIEILSAVETQGFKTPTNWIEVSEQTTLELITEKCGFDPLQIYCSKTGQPIGTRSLEQVLLTARVLDNDFDKVSQLISYLKTNACAAHWLRTDGKALDKLLTIDPVGYFVYLASLILKNKYEECYGPFDSIQVMFAHKIKAYADLSERLNGEQSAFSEINQVLRDFLITNPDDFNLPWADFPEFIAEFFMGDIQGCLAKAISDFRGAQANFKRVIHLQKLNTSIGPSNVRSQKATAMSRGVDDAEFALDKILEDAGFNLFDDLFIEPKVARSYTGSTGPKKKKGIKAFKINTTKTDKKLAEISEALGDVLEPEINPNSFAAMVNKAKEK